MRRSLVLMFMLGIFIFSVGFVDAGLFGNSASGGFGNPSSNFNSPTNYWQYQQPSFNDYYTEEQINTYWPIFSKLESDQCEATSDFIVAIPPVGCEPAVVRSDLLEEQNVPVFCKLDALKINPLIKVSSIKSVSFAGDYPEEVAGISFHPARAAVNSYDTLLGEPLLNNIGYVVLILKRQKTEDDMPDFVKGNLTATIHYDAEEAFGVGRSEFYLPVISNKEWEAKYAETSFWSGRGFVRAKGIGEGVAEIEIYTDKNNLFRTFRLEAGEESPLIYFPGYYCKAGLRVKLNDLVGVEDEARINVDGSEIWVREGSKILNGRCVVRDLVALPDGTGSVEITCPGKKESLILQRKGVEFSSGEEKKVWGLGDSLGYGEIDDESRYWNVGYSGIVPQNVKEIGGKSFVILVGSSGELDDGDLTEIAKNVKKVIDDGVVDADAFKENVVKPGIFSADYRAVFLVEGEEVQIGNFNNLGSEKEFVFDGFAKSVENVDVSDLVSEYYGKANESVYDLTEGPYWNEEKVSGDAFGEETLFNQIELAKELGRLEDAKNLMIYFLDKYPSSDVAMQMRYELTNLEYYDATKSYSNFLVNNKYYSVSVSAFKSVSDSDKSVDLKFGSLSKSNLAEGDKVVFDSGDKEENFVVSEIEAKGVKIIHNLKEEDDTKFDSDSYSIKVGSSKVINGREVYVSATDVEEVAHVSLIPEVKYTESEANFSFNVGIEKRNIKLSPEKTQEMIDNLNKSIAKWEEVNERLGKLVAGWKGACFVTSSFLMLKNAVANFDGESLARKKVMETYKEKCESVEYSDLTREECYNKLSEDIERDVDAMKDAINGVNSDLDEVIEKHKTSDGLFGSKVNVDAYKKDLKETIGPQEVVVNTPEGDKTFSIDDATTVEQLRSFMLVEKLEEKGLKDSVAYQAAKRDLDAAWRGVYLSKKANAEMEALKEKYGDFSSSSRFVDLDNREKKYWDGGVTNKEIKLSEEVTIEEGTPTQYVNYRGKSYILFFDKNQNNLDISNVAKVSKGEITTTSEKFVSEIKSKFGFETGGECSYSYKTKEQMIRYYDSGRNKGFPAIVPFDLDNGWYVKVPNSQGTILDGTKGYTEAGAVSYFKICNVGPNHIEENEAGDDFCQSFDVDTFDKVDRYIPCPSLDAREVQTLAQKAISAIREAQRQYGQSTVSILGQTMKVGSPLVDSGNVECTDFMSVQDCNTLFNVCDPVICPSSRCDLGGKMPVADVVQTGIVGSLIMCLPNFGNPAEGGVAVPICLTGLHAGIDSFVSILKAEQECLEVSLETGEHVGICDQITSIYLCEFFWRQFAPLVDVFIPQVVEWAYGGFQATRGGGEYLTIQSAWDSVQGSIDYFQNNYAQNAFRAFEIRSVQDVGTTFCKAFVGTSLPSSADFLESLLEPESPHQIYAWFSETPYSDATVPATSHYKVYFHIFAGKDESSYYRVYLKDPPAASYYKANPTVSVDTGFVAKGKFADKSLDFTAPSGYKELCVMVNSKEYCGFGQVSTDAGLNYLADKYVAEQAEKEITSEKECVSGTPSAWALASPNVREGVSDAVSPEIAMQGIVRVCASVNPSAGVYSGNDSNSSYAVWKDVGYCDDPNVRCWLDLRSVEGSLESVGAVESTLAGVEEKSSLLSETRLSYEDVRNVLSRARKEISELSVELEKVDDLDEEKIEEKTSSLVLELESIAGLGGVGAGTNADKAEALLLRAAVYQEVTRVLSGLGREVPSKEEIRQTRIEIGYESIAPEDDTVSDGDAFDGESSEKGEVNGKQEEYPNFTKEIVKVSKGSTTYFFKFEDSKWSMKTSGGEYTNNLANVLNEDDSLKVGRQTIREWAEKNEFNLAVVEKGEDVFEESKEVSFSKEFGFIEGIRWDLYSPVGADLIWIQFEHPVTKNRVSNYFIRKTGVEVGLFERDSFTAEDEKIGGWDEDGFLVVTKNNFCKETPSSNFDTRWLLCELLDREKYNFRSE